MAKTNMKNLSDQELKKEKIRLSRKCALDKTCDELEETLRLLALIREEHERRGMEFIKFRYT